MAQPFDRQRLQGTRFCKITADIGVQPVKTEGLIARNPRGIAAEIHEHTPFRAGLAANRAQLYIDVPTGPFFGFNREGAAVSQGAIDNWWRQGMTGGAAAHYDCIKAFSETDFTDDLRAITVPVLVLHGEDDQIEPIANSALEAIKLLKYGTLKTYPSLPHGMCTTHPDMINPDLLTFVES